MHVLKLFSDAQRTVHYRLKNSIQIFMEALIVYSVVTNLHYSVKLWSGVHWGKLVERNNGWNTSMQYRDMTWRMALQEQVTQSGQGLSRMVVALLSYTWERCEWGIIHPPASLTDKLRLWPLHQPHMEPDPRSYLPTRDYRPPILIPHQTIHDS